MAERPTAAREVGSAAGRLALGLAGFTGCWWAAEHRTPWSIELRLADWVNHNDHRSDVRFATDVAEVADVAMNDLGAPVMFGLFAVAAWRIAGRSGALVMMLAGLTTAVLRVVDLTSRSRPPGSGWDGVATAPGGFPSGHVYFVSVLFGALALLAHRYLRRPVLTRALTVGAAIAAVAMGVFRVLSRDHWMLDVVGSWLLAIVVIAGSDLVVSAQVRRRGRTQSTAWSSV